MVIQQLDLIKYFLENLELIEEDKCQNQMDDSKSIPLPIFRTRVISKIFVNKDFFHLYYHCNMENMCYQPKCILSSSNYTENSIQIPIETKRSHTVNEILESLFKKLKLKTIKDGVCYNYMEHIKSAPSFIHKTIRLYKIKPDKNSRGEAELNLYYRCSLIDSCFNQICPWSRPSYEASLNKKHERYLEPFVNI